MKIVYDGIEISSEKNIQDITLDYIYSKSEFFINKPDYKSSIVIPNTLRSYVNLISCFKEDVNSLEQFNRFLCNRIYTEIDNSKLKVFKRIVESNDEQFLIILFNCLLEIAENNFLDDSDEIYQLFLVKNPLNISLADIVAAFDYLEETLHVNNQVERDFLDYLKIYISLRIKKFNPHLLDALKLGGLVNDYNVLFRKEQSTYDRRDYRLFDINKVITDLSINERIWLSFFIPIIGLYRAEYRIEIEKVFARNRFSKNYSNAYFSPIYPLTSIYCYDQILNNVVDENNEEFRNAVSNWINSNKELSVLFDNFLFLEIFVKKLDYYTKYKIKDAQGAYSSVVYDFIFNGIPSVIEELRKEYSFLNNINGDTILSNPIFSFWMNNLEKCNSIIDKIHEHNYTIIYSKEIVSIAQKASEKYEKYFDKNIKNSQQGTKQAMNYLVKLFDKEKEIHKEFLKYRRQMDRQFNVGLNNIQNLLIKISNG